jgi:hypothetical protein
MSGRTNDGFNHLSLEPAIKKALERREISLPIPKGDLQFARLRVEGRSSREDSCEE